MRGEFHEILVKKAQYLVGVKMVGQREGNIESGVDMEGLKARRLGSKEGGATVMQCREA